jgi:hypothetical protein
VAEPLRRAVHREHPRECLDHVIVLHERHLQRLLTSYFA